MKTKLGLPARLLALVAAGALPMAALLLWLAVSAGSSLAAADLLSMLLMLALGVAAACWIGMRTVVRPTRQILGAVQRLEHGQLDARISLQGDIHGGEFARIARGFNLIADSLQLRQLDLQAELAHGRSAYAVLELVLNSMHDALVAVNSAGELLMFNKAAARLFPLDGPAPVPRQWPEQWGLYLPDGRTPYLTEDLPLARAARGETGRGQPLFVRNALVPNGRLLHCSYHPMRGEGGSVGGLVVFTDVTELQRLQAEQAAQFAQLGDAQRKLIEAQRVGRMGNWELDLRSGKLWWSDEVYNLFGVARSSFSGTFEGFVVRVHPDDRAMIDAARETALRDGGLMKVEYRAIKPDGQTVWMHEIAETRRGPDGEAVWFGGVVQDVSERKEAERAVMQSERELQEFTQMLQRMTEAAQDITGRQSLQETMQAVVDQARNVTGAHQAMVSLNVDNKQGALVTAVSMSEKYSTDRATAQMPDNSAVYSAVRESGRPMRVSQLEMADHPRRKAFSRDGDALADRGLLAVPLVDRDGRNIGLLLLSDKASGEFNERDEYAAVEMAQLASIALENAHLFQQVLELNAGLETRIAARTAELTRQERLYRTLAEQAPQVVWNTAADGAHLTFLNRAWYELVGGTPETWLGKSGLSAVHPDDRPEVLANWRRSSEKLTTFTGVRRLRARDGSYHTMSYKGAPVLDESGGVLFWVGIDADITEFKAIEGALRSSNHELEAFSYSVSHDLRAPLGAIGGFSRALSNKLEGTTDERTRHFLARIQAGVEKMEQLIDALLSLAKVMRAPLNYGPVDLSAMARETLEELQMANTGRKLDAQVQEGLSTLGDPRLLRVVLENLLGNAWKFTSQRDEACIEVGRVPDSSIFFVRDNGVGFDMAYASKLFGAFQRLHTEAEFPGTGIGLATVQRIVTRHQGKVWAESQAGKGAAFFFSLSEAAPPAWLAGDAAERVG
jgi:PAS domain S-box-containing protein